VLSATGDGSSDTRARDTKSASKIEQRREAADRRLSLKPLKDAMDKAEREVTKLHSEIEMLDAALAAPGLFSKTPAKGEALAKQRGESLRALEVAEARWMEAAEQYEAARA